MPGQLCAIHQPNFFPRLSTLAKLFTADIWVVLDDVQFTRRDYQHRCVVTGPDGAERWMTIPVRLPAGRPTLIRDVLISDSGQARGKVRGLGRHCFAGSPYWPAVRDLLSQVDDALARYDRLADVSEISVTALLRTLIWPGTICRSSEIRTRTGRSERLADLAVAVGASTYLCGTGGARYLDLTPFTTSSVSVSYFQPPESPSRQPYGHRVTSLATLAAAGPARLSGQLTEHAASWRALPATVDSPADDDCIRAGIPVRPPA
jgi:hypothetical protein